MRLVLILRLKLGFEGLAFLEGFGRGLLEGEVDDDDDPMEEGKEEEWFVVGPDLLLLGGS